jgi:hypothetical protein
MSEHVERALAEAYSLGALDPPEKKLFEAHLGSCRICRESVGGAAVVVNALALTAPKEAPPKGSGDRLMALYREQRAAEPPPPSRGSGGLGNTLAAVFALVGLGVAGWGYHEHDKVADLEKKVGALEKQVEKCQSEKEVLDAQDLTFKSFKGNDGYAGKLPMLAYSPTKGVAILAKSMPAPAEGKVYKLWYLADGKAPVPMGSFQPGVFMDRTPGRAADKINFAISEESDPNTTTPTRIILLPA